MVDAHSILLKVLQRHHDNPKWNDQPFERIKRISNAKVGDVGQDFVEALCEMLEIGCVFPHNPEGKRAKQSPWDIRISRLTFELKTATEDTSGNFQFNHIRYHRNYDALLCIGIAPSDIYMGVWSKAEILTGKAGNLVSMEKQANASYKLTKKPDQLHHISEFEERVLGFLTDPDA